jgi:hypothetical protein
VGIFWRKKQLDENTDSLRHKTPLILRKVPVLLYSISYLNIRAASDPKDSPDRTCHNCGAHTLAHGQALCTEETENIDLLVLTSQDA